MTRTTHTIAGTVTETTTPPRPSTPNASLPPTPFSPSIGGPLLPDRKYFKIGEVAELVAVEPHVLRYWETQFPQVRPHKARSGHRLYRRREVETLLTIKDLLHVQRFTIAGARQALRQHRTLPPTFTEELSSTELAEIEALEQSRAEMPVSRHESRPPARVTTSPRAFALHSTTPMRAPDAHVELEVHGLAPAELDAALEEQLIARQEERGVIMAPVHAHGQMRSRAPSPVARQLLVEAIAEARALLVALGG